MTRVKHLAWCKERALKYVEIGQLQNAVASMMSDTDKHPETQGHIGCELGAMLLLAGLLGTRHEIMD